MLEQKLLPDGALSGKVALHEGLVNDHDGNRVLPVCFLEAPALCQADVQGLEVAQTYV